MGIGAVKIFLFSFLALACFTVLAWQDYREQKIDFGWLLAFSFAVIVNFILPPYTFFLFGGDYLLWFLIVFVFYLFGIVAFADEIILLALPLWVGLPVSFESLFLVCLIGGLVWYYNFAMRKQVCKTYFLPLLYIALFFAMCLNILKNIF